MTTPDPARDRATGLPAFMGRAMLCLGAMLFLGLGLGMSVLEGVSVPWTLGLVAALAMVLVLMARWQVRLVAEPLGRLFRETQPMAIEDLPGAWSALEQENLDLKERAEREDHLLRSIMTRLEEGLLLFSEKGTMEIYNPSAQRLLGLGAPLAVGMGAQEVFQDAESPVAIQRAFLGVPSEWRITRAARMLRVRAIPFAPSGPVSGVLMTLDDITRQEALETTRQKFISNVSHELKTPVTAIRIAAENLQEEPLPETAQASAQSILRSVDRLALLLDDLSELSRIESGALRLVPERVSLDAFLDSVASDFSSRHRASGVALDIHREVPANTVVLADPLRLSQILENLLSNAVKFSPPGGHVVLSVEVTPQGHQWVVADSGPGIPEAEQGRIFERFYRAQGAKAKPGTGLGLAIVKHLCRLMGGEVTVDSRPGAGARFRVVLPLQSDQGLAGPPSR